MGWLNGLYNLSLLVSVGAGAIILCHVFPAFRRTRNKAFLFLAIASVLGIADTVFDHTVSLKGLGESAYIVIRTLRRFGYFADVILSCAGIVLLARPYLKAPSEPPRN